MASALQLESARAAKRLGNIDHAARIAARLAPDPREWAYSGVVTEDRSGQARCSCGHPIVVVYWIERARDGARAPIGSTCIDSTVPWLLASGAESLARALESARAEYLALQRERERREREADADRDLAELRAEIESWRAPVKAALADLAQRYGNGWFPEDVFPRVRDLRGMNACLGHILARPALSTPRRTLASVARYAADLWIDSPHLPAPKHPAVRGRLQAAIAEAEEIAAKHAGKYEDWSARALARAERLRARLGAEPEPLAPAVTPTERTVQQQGSLF